MNNFNSRILASAAALSFNAGLAIAVDTVIGVGGIPDSSSLLKDYNNDQIITDADIVLQLLSLLGDGPDADQDGDGVSTALDTVLAIEQAVHSSCGDLDKSTTVNLEDVNDFLMGITAGDYSVKFDVNADRIVDSDDLLVLLANIELQDIVYLDGLAYVWLPSMLVRARLEGDTALWLDQSDTRSHDTRITEGWTRVPLHAQSSSNGLWPANHERSLSLFWPVFDHGFVSSQRDGQPLQPHPQHTKKLSKLWPPNHLADFSASWPEVHATRISYTEDIHYVSSSYGHQKFNSGTEYEDNPNRHDEGTSLLWTRLHDGTTSLNWRTVPNHLKRNSNSWYTTPNVDHYNYTSQLWRPNHAGFDSRKNGPRPVDHTTSNSRRWTHGSHISRGWPPNHEINISTPWIHSFVLSKAFPPNHQNDLSQTWLTSPQHTRALSLAWPANHHAAVSSGWLEQIGPGTWPANHHVVDSNNTGTPRPAESWPLWPANHDWLTSVKDFSEIIENIVPLIP